MNAVARNLKRLRKQTGLTQEELAERLHVTRQAVSSWETAKTQPDIETLTALAEALGTDVNELIYGPRPDGEGYVRYQKKYIAWTAACAAVSLTGRALLGTLDPWLQMYQRARYAAVLCGLTLQMLVFLAVGAILPAAASIWKDIRIQSRVCRRSFLAAGVALITLLLVVEGLFLIALTGGDLSELISRQYTRFMGLVAYILQNHKLLALSGGLCLFLGLNR